ncbi:hypothetical protein ACFWP5_24410 [Streptomyces sp. NPDC058469]|uniref:hypothetical protein n=1 Tax=Streptomyces sp. NPDC058469 TaxID=3346514 RepID=UPI00364A24EA
MLTRVDTFFTPGAGIRGASSGLLGGTDLVLFAQQVLHYTTGQEARTVRVTGRENGESQAVWILRGGHRGSGKVPADYCNDEYTEEELAIFAGEDWGVRERNDLLWSAAQQLTLIAPGVLMMWLLGRARERRRLATRVKSRRVLQTAQHHR